MKIVKYYDDLFEANADREFLESEGITAVVLNENTGTVLPITLAVPSLRPHIVVNENDYIKAIEILGIDEENKKIICPDCGSEEIKYGFGGKSPFRKFLLRFIMLPMAFITLITPGAIKGNFYCKKCRKEFKVR